MSIYQWSDPELIEQLILVDKELSEGSERMTDWELEFVENMRDATSLSDKQRELTIRLITTYGEGWACER